MNIVSFSLISLIFLSGCSLDISDDSVGPNGEPPKALERIYRKDFTISERNYVKSLGMIHEFAISNKFYPIYNKCFNDVLDIKVIAITERYTSTFPCLVLQAEKGVPTKSYLTSSVNEVKFNQLDNDNRLILTVNIFGNKAHKKELALKFSSNIEPELTKLYKSTLARSP